MLNLKSKFNLFLEFRKIVKRGHQVKKGQPKRNRAPATGGVDIILTLICSYMNTLIGEVNAMRNEQYHTYDPEEVMNHFSEFYKEE